MAENEITPGIKASLQYAASKIMEVILLETDSIRVHTHKAY